MNLSLQPALLRWARERAGLSPELLAEKIHTKPDRVVAWEQTGELRFRQAETLAKVTHTPFGFLFLPQPPDEPLGIPDFRTVRDGPVSRPSPDLIDTVRQMQCRQAWMREFLIEEGAEPLGFVGSARADDSPEETAAQMRETLGLRDGWAQLSGTWSDALRQFRQRIEAAGILTVVNGIVGNNTHRKLSVQEFRGLALSDPYAPLIFVNGADGKAAQMFTMAHEAAHLWLGRDGVANLDMLEPSQAPDERRCNAAAAEFLVPAAELSACWSQAETSDDTFQYLARRFKVSPIVAARRAADLGLISRPAYRALYHDYDADERRSRAAKDDGGSFWNSQIVRIGERFGTAVARATKEGRLLYRDAYRLTGLRGDTVTKFAESLGVRLR
jgi:Zn-dependent peptidase ImmA (M78 family)